MKVNNKQQLSKIKIVLVRHKLRTLNRQQLKQKMLNKPIITNKQKRNNLKTNKNDNKVMAIESNLPHL